MRKEKFVYNKQTLRYEKVVNPLRVKLLRGLAITCGIFLYSMVAIFLYDQMGFVSSREKAKDQELKQAEIQLNALNQKFEDYSKIIDNMRERQEGAFTMAFGQPPIDDDVWEGGVGGADRYSNLVNYETTGQIMRDVTSRADKLGRQMSLLSHSLDTIISLARDREKQFASVPSIKPIREDKLKRKIQLLSGFGRRLHPIHKLMLMHEGIDFSAPSGTDIFATGDGEVIRVENKKSGYGKNVILSHGYGYETLYAHMSQINVEVGQKVKRGEVIGLVGSTGTSTAPHLHYEVHYMGKPVNPIHFVLDGLTTEEYQKMVEMASLSNQALH